MQWPCASLLYPPAPLVVPPQGVQGSSKRGARSLFIVALYNRQRGLIQDLLEEQGAGPRLKHGGWEVDVLSAGACQGSTGALVRRMPPSPAQSGTCQLHARAGRCSAGGWLPGTQRSALVGRGQRSKPGLGCAGGGQLEQGWHSKGLMCLNCSLTVPSTTCSFFNNARRINMALSRAATCV